MFLLIFYCSLISFVVSARSNNDNISTTFPTLPKYCIWETTESEISQIVELFNNNVVNVVDIHVSFSGTSHDKHLLSDFHVSLMNPIGREILHTLYRRQFGSVTWTLYAGIRNFELHFIRNQNECIKRKENVTNFALENTQNIIRSINLATNYEVCSSCKGTSLEIVRRTCCQITKSNSKFNYGCSKPKSFLHESRVPWNVITLMMLLFCWFYSMWLLLALLSHTEFDLKYPKYYKLEESRMSPFFILFKITFERNDRLASFIRSGVLIGVFSYCTYSVFWPIKILNVFMLILFLFWGLSFSISYLYRSKITDSNILLIKIKRERRSLPNVWFFGNLQYVEELRQQVYSGDFACVIKLFTLPFNLNLWRKKIKDFHSLFTTCTTCVDNTLGNRILKMFSLFMCYALAVPICFFYVCFVFLYLIMIVIAYPSTRIGYTIKLIQNLEYKTESCCSQFLSLFHQYGLLLFFGCTLIVMTHSIQSFLLGLFLNLIYFISYFALFSVLTFYSCSFWKTMEEKYCVLKRLIYEACRDKRQVNNGCIPNRHPKREEKVLPVVSKELYGKIKEELLPYDIELFYFALKIFWSLVFSFGIFQLINMLNELNVTGVVQVVTTASLGIMPHIFNMVGLKTSEEGKKAWEEKLKLNVKYMVEELVGENPELASTVLIMEEDNDIMTSEENIQDSEHVQASSDLNLPDNFENPELAGVLVIQDDIDTRTDENVEARSALNPPDNDDVEDPELAPTVAGQENNDTIAEENVQDSERIEARFDLNPPDNDDGLPIVIIHLPSAKETLMRDDTTADDRAADETAAGGWAAYETAAGDTIADDTTAVGRTAVDTTADYMVADETAAGERADDTTADGSTADNRATVIRSSLNSSDNADVDDAELAGTVTRQECNDTTENIQDNERVEGFELDQYDNIMT